MQSIIIAANFHQLSKLNVANGGCIWNTHVRNLLNSHSRILQTNKFLNFNFASFTRKQINTPPTLNNIIKNRKDFKFNTNSKNSNAIRGNNQKTPSVIDKDLVCKPNFILF